MSEEKGLYIYCVAQGDLEESLEMKGIGGSPVLALTRQGLVSIVQEASPKPFKSEDQNVLADWLLIHQNVVDMAWERYETIIPFGFDTLIVPKDGKTARQNLDEWMEKESEELQKKLNRLKNKAEYGVQIVWDPTLILTDIRLKDVQIQELELQIVSQPKGVAYMMQKQLEGLTRDRLEKAADEHFKTFYRQIRDCVEAVHVEKVRKEPSPKQMILNVSCLQEKEKAKALGESLDKIGRMHGFDVRFTGPWPPYSFTNI